MKINRGDKGQDVVFLQTLLRDNGFIPGPIDGVFGPATEKALHQFQASQGLKIGNASEVEIDALKGKKERLASHIPSQISALAPEKVRKLLEHIRAEVGVEEYPLGQNKGPRVDVYTKGWAVPWCAAFVSWAFNTCPLGPEFEPTKKWVDPYLYAVVKWKQKLEELGTYVDATQADRDPQPGDIFIILYPGADGVDPQHGHTGFVVSYDPERKVVGTIEGNTSNGVRSKERPRSSLSGWGTFTPALT
jgi:hypothetical protein